MSSRRPEPTMPEGLPSAKTIQGMLENELARLSVVSPRPEALERLAMHLHLLYRWNATVNLTGIRDLAEGIRRHTVESLEALELIRDLAEEEDAFLVDLGSGNGFPALPLLHCFPELRGELIESSLRKVDFIQTVVRKTGVGDRVRAEQTRVRKPRDLPSGATIVSMRAFPDPTKWTPDLLKKLSLRAVVVWLSQADGQALRTELLEKGYSAELHPLASHASGALLIARP